jgi:hypothetical protein
VLVKRTIDTLPHLSQAIQKKKEHSTWFSSILLYESIFVALAQLHFSLRSDQLKQSKTFR